MWVMGGGGAKRQLASAREFLALAAHPSGFFTPALKSLSDRASGLGGLPRSAALPVPPRRD